MVRKLGPEQPEDLRDLPERAGPERWRRGVPGQCRRRPPSEYPGGKWESAIGKGKLFESDWIVGDTVYECTASAAGKTWLLGISPAGQAGWVQTDDLTFVEHMHPDPSS